MQAEDAESRSDNGSSHEANQKLPLADFLSAIEKGVVDRVEEIISKHEETKSITFEYSFPDNTSDEYVTPLMVATVHAQREVAGVLLEKGVDVHSGTLEHC